MNEATRLDQLGDDELQCVFLANDKFDQDVLFLALTCRSFLRMVRRAFEKRHKDRRSSLRLVPVLDPHRSLQLSTSVEGLYVSRERVNFAVRHISKKCLPAEHAMGAALKGQMLLMTLPTETLWHFIKVAPCDLIIEIYNHPYPGWPHRGTGGRALLMFSARHGRVDVLKALTKLTTKEADTSGKRLPWMDFVFTRSCLVCQRALPGQRPHSNGQSDFDEMVATLIRPALLGRQDKVLDWIRQTSGLVAQRHGCSDLGYWRYNNLDGYVDFAGIYVTRHTLNLLKGIEGGGLRQLRLSLLDASLAGFAAPFLLTLTQIVCMWTEHKQMCEMEPHVYNPSQREWLAELCYIILVGAFDTRGGRGRLTKAIVAWCDQECRHLSDMFHVANNPPQNRFDLVNLAEAQSYLPTRHLEHVSTHSLYVMAFHPGDGSYNAWMLKQMFADGLGQPNWLLRAATAAVVDHPSIELDFKEVCRQLVTRLIDRTEDPNQELRRPGLTQCSAKYHRIGPENFVYVSQLVCRKGVDELEPNVIEKSIARVIRLWLSYELRQLDAPLDVTIWHYAAVETATTAMLPVMEHLYTTKEFTDTQHKRKGLRTLIIDSACVCFGDDRYAADKEDAMIAHLALAYRHHIITRKDWNTAYGDSMRTSGLPKALKDIATIDSCFDAVDSGRLYLETSQEMISHLCSPSL